MSRPADWAPVQLYSDPVPGDPSGVLRASQRYLTIADSIADAKLTILGVFDNDELVGESIDAVREVALDVADRIGRAKERYLGVGNALAGYVHPLEVAQRDSENILNGAIAARDERIYAEGRVYYWERELDEAVAAQDPTRSTKAEDKIEYWRGQMYEASNATSAAVHSLQAVIDARNTAANAAADAIEQVENSGGLNDDFWNNVDQWFEENPWINTVIEWAGYAAAVLAIVAMFVPGLNLLVLIVGIALLAVTVANAVLQAMTGNKPWGQAIFEILMAAIPFGVGKGLSHVLAGLAAKVPKQAVTSLLISSARTGAGVTRPGALATVAEELAKRPQWLRNGDVGNLADITQLAKMPLTSGNISQALAAMGKQGDNLITWMVSMEVVPSSIGAYMSVNNAQLGDMPSWLGGDALSDDMQNHRW